MNESAIQIIVIFVLVLLIVVKGWPRKTKAESEDPYDDIRDALRKENRDIAETRSKRTARRPLDMGKGYSGYSGYPGMVGRPPSGISGYSDTSGVSKDFNTLK